MPIVDTKRGVNLSKVRLRIYGHAYIEIAEMIACLQAIQGAYESLVVYEYALYRPIPEDWLKPRFTLCKQGSGVQIPSRPPF
jgi:hypothetical protein